MKRSLAILLVGFLAFGCERKSSDTGSGTAEDERSAERPSPGNPGPVEHIDAAERLEATKLEIARDPIGKEIDVFRAEVRGAFDEERFGELDEMAKDLRKSSAVFDNGSVKLFQFYEGLADRYNSGENGYLTDFKKYDKWRESNPESLAAAIGLANLWIEYAWFARGSGYSDTVSDEQWEAFGARLDAAGKTLGEAAKLSDSDPYWYVVALTVGLGQGWPAENFDAVTEEGNKLAPTFWGIDVKRAYSLLPRWHGEPGDWEKFAEKVSRRKGGLGAEAYARIVMNQSSFYPNMFRDSKASWKITREGLLTLREKYPKSKVIHNYLAYFAVSGRDRELAKATFDELGEEYSPEVWGKPELFVHFRTWARTGKW